MFHKHSVYDTDLHFIIDPITRTITSECGKVKLMQYDHNSERFTFQLPRYIEAHDMSLCNVSEVHYTNKESGHMGREAHDIYPMDDLQISPDSEDVVICSWLISQNATGYDGSLEFLLRFACIDEETAEITYQWFTDIYDVTQIEEGIYHVEVVTHENDPDTLFMWKQEIQKLGGEITGNAAKSAEEAAKSAASALASEQNAKASELAAKTSEEAASASEIAAKESEENAKQSENIAVDSATAAEDYAKISQSYAVGGTAIRVDEETDNSKYYSEVAKNATNEALETLTETNNTLLEINQSHANVTFSLDYDTGKLEYESAKYTFHVNETTGNLEWEVVT